MFKLEKEQLENYIMPQVGQTVWGDHLAGIASIQVIAHEKVGAKPILESYVIRYDDDDLFFVSKKESLNVPTLDLFNEHGDEVLIYKYTLVLAGTLKPEIKQVFAEAYE